MIEPGDQSGLVRLTLRYGWHNYSDNWQSENDVTFSELSGLSTAEMNGAGATTEKQQFHGDLTLGELRRARDHGVTKGFIRRVIERDGGKPSLDELIRLRDRGM